MREARWAIRPTRSSRLGGASANDGARAFAANVADDVAAAAAAAPGARRVFQLRGHHGTRGSERSACCQRTDGVDRAFSTAKTLNWLRAERPSESTLAYSAETLLFGIIWRCLYYVGEPVDVRAGLLSKEHVEAIISSVRFEMDEIKKENGVWLEAEIVTKAAQLGLSPMASSLGAGIWIARCPGTNHTIQMQPKRNLFYCGYCRVGGGKDELDEFAAQRKEYSWRKNLN